MVIIKKNRNVELPDYIKWLVVNTKYNCADACVTFIDAFRYYLWNIGVSPKIAFKRFKPGKNGKFSFRTFKK